MRISFIVFIFVTIYIQKSNSVDFKYLSVFNFGDSNSDTGDLVAGLGVHLDLPNGQNYFKISSQRFCDGRLVIDYLSFIGLNTTNQYFDRLVNVVMVVIDTFILLFLFLQLYTYISYSIY
ncbi:unnamed protein product [Brassica oleracea]|uniref:Uncharacterized protein n=2 Tax=Brassica TaxID=3705 RepID=A0A3P6CM29_BRAOL|nr:unnamed protein product [Brassica napus]VDD08559.1 unnamed protein product [Brassica oleracea]